MKVVTRASVTAVLAVCVSVVPAALAEAHSKLSAVKSHHVSLSGAIETLSSTGKPGVTGVKDTDAGILDGTISRSPHFDGALRQVVTWGPALAITARGKIFGDQGSLRFKLTGKFGLSPSGVLGLSAKVTVVGGTGIYAGAHGALQASGVASVAAGSTESTLKLTGTVRYRG
jgi:hypothetical protein